MTQNQPNRMNRNKSDLYAKPQERILVLGAGRLSVNIASYFPNVMVLDKATCDITNREAVAKAVHTHKPSIVMNAAAITSPVLCEQEHGLAWRVNVYGARNIAAVCENANVWSLHISSNWAAEPVNEYAITKRVSEDVGFDLSVRTCFYDEAYWVLSSLGRGDVVKLTDNDEFNPISVVSLLKVIERFIKQRTQGIVNVGTAERLSHYDFGVMLARAFGLSVDLIIPDSEVGTSYRYPYHTYLEPHSYSRISIEEDLRGFRDSTAWGYEGTMAADQRVPDLRVEPERDSRLR
jgi:dTDP-4-dehydrorhamnose reductase